MQKEEEEEEEERDSYKTCTVLYMALGFSTGSVYARQCLALLMIELFSIPSPKNTGLSCRLL
jgi:hypothetical protein